MNIDEELAMAWRDVSRPARRSVTSHRCSECDEIAAVFGDKVWSELVDVEVLRYNEVALSLFTPQAFHYYLPAFMRAVLSDPVRADVIPDGIILSLQQEFGPASRNRLPLFTLAQRNAVARFLRMLPSLGVVSDNDAETLAALLEVA